MTRAFTRPLTAVALAAALALAVVPSVDAGPRLPDSGGREASTDWLASAWSWLADLVSFEAHRGVTITSPRDTHTTEVTRTIAKTGSCIDPLGNWYPSAQGLMRPPGGLLTSPSAPVH
jgi:hypothetical protein